jgi:Collagen triple helix repeat (20 copies)
MKRIFILLFCTVPLFGQTTTVSQSVLGPDGQPANGRVSIQISQACRSFTSYVGMKPINVTVSNGVFSQALVPNDSCVPSGTSYAVTWQLTGGNGWTETWLVPTSITPVTVDSVVTQNAPAPSFVIQWTQMGQNGASPGQVPIWNGLAWLPTNATALAGPAGPTGPQGPQGIAGVIGATGPQGTAGATGSQGPQGVAGLTGPIGPIGLTGSQGPSGVAGSTGPAGASVIGAQGIAGPTGPQGVAGPTGPAGSLSYTAENIANKGAANGYAALDSNENVLAAGLIASGSGAGAFEMTAGAAQTPLANSVGLQAPTSVPTGFNINLWGVPAIGVVHATTGNVLIPSLILAADLDPSMPAVDTSGSYTDLLNQPTIPSTTTQISEGTNLYFTTARAIAALAGLYQTPITGAPSIWPTLPGPSTVLPLIDGAAAIGVSANYALADHVHPTDTSRLALASVGVAGGVAPLNVNGLIPSSYQTQGGGIPTKGLLAQWYFAQGAVATTLYDSSGKGCNGTLAGTTLPTWGATGLTFGSSGAPHVTLACVPAVAPAAVGFTVTPAAFSGTQKIWGATSGTDYYNSYDGVIGTTYRASADYAGAQVFVQPPAIPTAFFLSQRGDTGIEVWLNGYLSTVSTVQTAWPTAFTMSGISDASSPFAGLMEYCCGLVYSRKLTDWENVWTYQSVASANLARGIAMPTAQTFPTNGQMQAQGDSITANTGCTPTSACYTSLIAAAKNWTLNGHGISGTQCQGQAIAVYGQPVAPLQVNTWLSGYNDMRNYGASSTGQATYSNCFLTLAAFMAIPDALKIEGRAASGVTYTGTWAVDQVAIGEASSTAGATATIGPLKGPGTLYLATFNNTGGSAAFTVAIDGGTAVAVAANTGTTDGNSIAYAPQLYRVPGLGPGNHTVVITQTGGTIDFSWAAIVNTGLVLAPQNRFPRLYVGNCLKMNATGYPLGTPFNAGSDVSVLAFNTIILQDVTLLQSDGLSNIFYVNAEQQYNPNTEEFTDNIHPANAGHAAIANAFLAVIQ